MQEFEKQWQQCLDIIKENLKNEEAFKAFFSCCQPIAYEDGRLKLMIPSHYVFEHLEGPEYFGLLSSTLRRIYGPKIRLSYTLPVVKEDKKDSDKKDGAVTYNPARVNIVYDNTFETHLNPNCTFESFCGGKSNELCLSAAITASKRPGTNAFNPLFIFGPSGVGKTHLAQAVGHKILEDFPEKKVLYVTAQTFGVQYADAARRKVVPDFINFYQNIDVLIVDDIQEFAGANKTATQNCFFHIFNHLHMLGKQLVMTCDRPPVELEEMVDRLLTRFKWGFIGAIEHPDYQLRYDILESKCRKEGLTLNSEILDFIARNATDNARDLEGIINSLLAHSIAYNRPIDRLLAERVMRMIVKIENKTVTCESILAQVIEVFKVDAKSINSKSRKQEISQARQAAMYLCKQHTTQSISRIGTVIGGRDHATVIHAIKNVEELMQTNEDFKNKVLDVEAKIGA